METCENFLAKEQVPSHKNFLAKAVTLKAFLIVFESSYVMASPVNGFFNGVSRCLYEVVSVKAALYVDRFKSFLDPF